MTSLIVCQKLELCTQCCLLSDCLNTLTPCVRISNERDAGTLDAGVQLQLQLNTYEVKWDFSNEFFPM